MLWCADGCLHGSCLALQPQSVYQWPPPDSHVGWLPTISQPRMSGSRHSTQDIIQKEITLYPFPVPRPACCSLPVMLACPPSPTAVTQSDIVQSPVDIFWTTFNYPCIKHTFGDCSLSVSFLHQSTAPAQCLCFLRYCFAYITYSLMWWCRRYSFVLITPPRRSCLC